MKKTIFAISIILTLLLAACSNIATEPVEEPTTDAATEEPEAEAVEPQAEVVPINVEMLTASTWAWIGFTDPMQQIAIEDPLSYTVTFNDDGTVGIVADCNVANGSYVIDGSNLTIEVGPMTMALCPPESRSEDFVNYFGSSAIYFLEDGNLYIDLMADGGTMAFTPEEMMMADDGEGAIAGILQANPWQWVSFTNPMDQYDVEMPENYMLQFNTDGSVNIKADCNQAMGEYSADSSSLTIEVGPMTRAMCPPESRSDDFVKYLGASAKYFFEEGHLFIDLMADGGTMEFAPSTMASMTDMETGTMVSLTSHTWELHSYVYNNEVVGIETPENYTVTFNPDGSLAVKADCNNANGDFTDDGTSLNVTIGPSTMALCPEGSRSEQFLEMLGLSGNYEIVEGFLFIALNDESGIMNFSLQNILSAEFLPDADPIFGTVNMNLQVDPFMISMVGGVVEGYGLDASTLGEACVGTISSRPDVVFEWNGYEGIDMLRVFFLSLGDPTLVLVTPSGDVLCNDDLNPLVLDPFIEMENPEPGRYAAFVGNFEADMVDAGFLVITSQEYDPATLDIAQLFPRDVDPRAASTELVSLDALDLENTSVLQPSGGTLMMSSLPLQQNLTAGGELGFFNLDQPNHLCTGFISAAPNFRFDWSENLDELILFFESEADTTLGILAPDGNFYCDDDYQGADNLNPWISLAPTSGTYYVWVGSFAPDVMVDGLLTITSDTNATPVILTSDDLN